MDLDDLKQSWEEHDRKLEARLTLNGRRVQVTLGKAETALRRLSRLELIGAFFNLAAVLWLGSFLGDHWTQARFALPALGLDLFALTLLAAGIRQVAALAKLDLGEPIVTLQKRMESLRAERLLTLKWVFLASPLLWILGLVVLLRVLGVDAYAVLPSAWLAGNFLFGLAVIPLAVWLSRRYAGRLDRSPLARRIARDLAGYNLNAAEGFLASLARFEEEA